MIAGSSSNHATFWSLTISIANVKCGGRIYQDNFRPSRATGFTTPVPQPPSSSIPNDQKSASNLEKFPEREIALKWIAQFCDTIGAVLPFVGESDLVKGLDNVLSNPSSQEQPYRSTKAFLNLVFSHALIVTEEESPRPFYYRALALLDLETLYVPSLDLCKLCTSGLKS